MSKKRRGLDHGGTERTEKREFSLLFSRPDITNYLSHILFLSHFSNLRALRASVVK